MIDRGVYDNFDKENEYITIDLSDRHHKNRVVDLLESVNILSGEYEYKIKAQWTNDQYHPTMTMSEDDVIKFHNELGKWIDKIHERRNG